MQIKRKLYFDIETIRSEQAPSKDEIKVPGNYSKPETIEKYIQENLELEWNKTALNSLKGRIFCIGYAIDDEPTKMITGTEEEIIKEFEKIVMENVWMDWIGHNILTFDLPFIYHRAIKYGCKSLRNVVPHEKYPKNVYDTLVMWAGTDYKNMTSVKSIAKFLGIDNHKDEMDGSKVGELWLAGEYSKIYDYCKADVELERKIYKMLEE